jgi:hypothetical protein
MADIKKILIFSGITLAVLAGGIFALKVIDDKKKTDAQSERDAKIAALKAIINNPSSTPEEKEVAKKGIKDLLAEPILGIGWGFIKSFFPPKKGDEPIKEKPTKPIPSCVPPKVLNSDKTKCIATNEPPTKPTPTCIAPKVLNSGKTGCINPPKNDEPKEPKKPGGGGGGGKPGGGSGGGGGGKPDGEKDY